MDKFPEIPGYKIERKLGESSLARVFLGSHEDTGRRVAIKVLNPGLMQDKAFARRFMEEARNSVKMLHPNIANIVEARELGEFHYIVVEDLPESLRDKIKRQFDITGSTPGQLEIERGAADLDMQPEPKTGEKLEGRRLLDILRQLVQALAYAHKSGNIHKNIRPENIRFREDGTPILVDLFISNVLGMDYREALRAKGITFGSVYYASPEQALKKREDGKSDIYSLGVVLYEILTGQVPYMALETIAVENQHVMEPVPQLPTHLEIYQPLLDRMMDKDKEKRISAGIELVRLIDELLRQFPEDTFREPIKTVVPTIQDIPFEPVTQPGQDIPFEPVTQPGQDIPFEPGTPPEPGIPFESESPLESGIPFEPETPPEPGISFEPEILPKSGISYESEESFEEEIPLEARVKQLDRQIQKGKWKGKKDFSQLFRSRRILMAVVGVIAVIVLVVVVVIKPFSSGDAGEKPARVQGGEEKQKPLTPGEQSELQSKERQFQQALGLAQRFLNKGQIQNAVEKMAEAETFVSTPASKQLLEDMKLKVLKKKDDMTFKKASAGGTISAVEDYLQQYPSGVHVKEANEALTRLKEEKKKEGDQRKRILAAIIRLRSQYKDLSVDDVKRMMKEYGFFEKYYNKSGNFKNHFEVRTIGKDQIVVDFATGLIWHQVGSEKYMKMAGVEGWLADLNKKGYAGFSDWRLPTLAEAASLLENQESGFGLFIDPVFSSEQSYIWTGDTFGKDRAWVIDYYSGDVNQVTLTTMVYVRPVRTMKEFTP